MPHRRVMPTDPRTLIDELTADLEPEAAVELTVELTRMIDLGLLDLEEDDHGPPRIVIAPPPPDLGERRSARLDAEPRRDLG
jgi:hypothetical protein